MLTKPAFRTCSRPSIAAGLPLEFFGLIWFWEPVAAFLFLLLKLDLRFLSGGLELNAAVGVVN